MIDFSFIVPVYNSEKTINRCLDSIKKQTYANYEVIIIDDGSSDSSGLICDKYANNDDRFRVIHINNRGVSHARNTGLANVKGRYVCFVDSDDFIEKDLLQHIYNRCLVEDFQLGIWGYNCVKNDEIITSNIYEYYPDSLSSLEFLDKIYDIHGYRGYLWNKVFVLDIIRKHNIMFDENILMCEDLVFCCEYAKYINSIFLSKTSYYNYVMNEDSAVHKIRYKVLKSREVAAEKLLQLTKGFSEQNSFVWGTKIFCTEVFIMDIFQADFRNKEYEIDRIYQFLAVVDQLNVIKFCKRKVQYYYFVLKICPRFSYYFYRFLCKIMHKKIKK